MKRTTGMKTMKKARALSRCTAISNEYTMSRKMVAGAKMELTIKDIW
jgi:hypothetical protein